LIFGAVAAAGCASTKAPQSRFANAESMYTQQPWAQKPPTNITARFNAIQGALAGAQLAVNSYYDASLAGYRAHNDRVFLQAEIARNQAAMNRELQERLEEERLAALRAEPPRIVTLGKIDPATAPVDFGGFIGGHEVGQAVAGWMRVQRDVISDVFRSTTCLPYPC
jgi:hypothetical protein